MLQPTQDEQHLAVSLPATLEAIEEADELATGFLTARSVVVDTFALRIMLREALLNAVVHGSARDPQRTVHLELAVGSDEIVLTVEDSGPGFDWQGRRMGPEALTDGGRGLAIMEIYADRMVLNPRGNRVQLHKKLKASAEQIPQGAGRCMGSSA